MEFVIGIVLFVLVIVIWAAMSDASAKKYLNNLSFPHLSHCKLDQTNDSALTQRINWQSDT